MRSLVELLGYLRSQGVVLSLDGDALKCSAPTGVLTPELREELTARKPEIIAFLRASRTASGPAGRGIPRIDRSKPLPLSFAQQRLWFLNQLDPRSSVYNNGIALRIEGPLNVDSLDRTLKEIVRRHEDLRTTFFQVDEIPQTVICGGENWSMEVMDARHLSAKDQPSLARFAAELVRQHFDIARGPLFRAHLLAIGLDHHVLVLNFHHIISDGWSIGVLVNEFAELYPAYATGRTPMLPPLSVQYVDFAAWQREWLESGELDRQLPYWKKQLAGAPPVVVFPPDHRRPSTEMFRGARSKIVVPAALTRSLEQLSHSQNVTLFMTLLAAFNVLLARYTGLDDIVVGSPSANRSRAELNPLIGFFVNNLVLRTDLSGDPTFAELLARVRDTTLRAYEHQDVPFDVLVRELRPERSLDHSPLFQTMFILQNFPLDELNLAGIKATQVEMEVDTARFDLTVEVFPRNGELWLYFDYNSDLYEFETIQRIQQHYIAVLQAVCADPQQKIYSIPLLLASERQRLLVEWNQTEAPIPLNCCFYEQFQAQARATPDRIAVLAGEDSLTYGELDERSDQIARYLRVRGAGPEKLVAVFLDRSVEMVATLLGVAKSGAAYIPLDPAYPKARIASIFEDALPLAVLTSKHLRTKLPDEFAAPGMQVLCTEDIEAVAHPAADVPLSVNQENLAYVIFTSGSTGRPKGVQITHRALMNFLESMAKEPGMTAEDVLLAVTTISFDIAALELLLPLYTGATVCIAVQPGDPAALLEDIERYRPTVMQATPATWKLLIAAGWKGNSRLKILCGGEALDTDLARSLLVRSSSLWNMYGPTETTIWSAALHVESATESAIPVGRPIQNTEFYVLDPFLQPAPQGVPGELWIGGDGLARGYLNRPDLTNERFIASPFANGAATGAGARLYRTGDLVRYRADGTLDFLGRMDHQIKFRGFRIELGEIENALRQISGVLDAVVLLREDDGEKMLVGYMVALKGDLPSIPSMRENLRQTLPEYMVPGAFVFLKEMPRLPNGKLNRAALPAPGKMAAEKSANFDVSATGLQESVASVFRDVLHLERVGVDDNFFDLGAHSLQIVKVHGELNRRLDSNISLISFFQYPTIRLLGHFIEQSRQNEASQYGETAMSKIQ